MKYITFIIFNVFIFSGMAQMQPWVRISPEPIEASLNEITQIPGTERLIAVGTGASVLYTDDMGANWHVNYRPAGISRFVSLNAIHFVDSNVGYIVGSESTILKTINAGYSWDIVEMYDSNDIIDVYFHDELHGSIIKSGRLFTTDDGCITWDSVPYAVSNIYYINDSIGYINGTVDSCYYKTVDGGENWELNYLSNGYTDFNITDLWFFNEDTGLISGRESLQSNYYNKILKTTDGGYTWIEKYSYSLNWPDKIWFIDNTTGFALGHTFYHAVLLKTTDGGETWSECDLPYLWWWMTSICVLDDGRGLYVGDWGQITATINFGEDWIIIDNHLTNQRETHDIDILNDSVLFVSGCIQEYESGSIYKSVDRGETWDQVLSTYHEIKSLCFSTPEIGYACMPYSYGKLWKSIDAGESWNEVDCNTQIDEFKVIYFINDSVGFLGGEADEYGCYKTIDGGDTWYEITGEQFNPNYIIDFAFVDDSTGWAICEEVVLKTEDQGDTWELAEEFGFYDYSKMKFISDSIGFLVGTYFYKTVDAGNTWYNIDIGYSGWNEMTDITFPTNDIGYLTISEEEETILKSLDGGESWFPIDFPCTSTATCLGFFSEDEGLVFGDGGIIFKTYSGGVVDIPEFPVENSGIPKLQCFPVPAMDYVKVDFDHSLSIKPDNIEVYNLHGQLLCFQSVLENQDDIIIETTSYKSGVYLIIASDNHGVIATGKFVVTK